jgi:DNA-binding MarR family transcriptional regulator
MTEAQIDAWRSLMVIWRLGFGRLDRTFRRHGIIHIEYGILSVLSEAPDRRMPAGELAELSGLTGSHLSHRLKVMESRGHIDREPSPTDGRGVLVALTDQGEELRRTVAPEHNADVQDLMFNALTADEVETLAGILSKVASPLTAHPFARRYHRP